MHSKDIAVSALEYKNFSEFVELQVLGRSDQPAQSQKTRTINSALVCDIRSLRDCDSDWASWSFLSVPEAGRSCASPDDCMGSRSWYAAVRSSLSHLLFKNSISVVSLVRGILETEDERFMESLERGRGAQRWVEERRHYPTLRHATWKPAASEREIDVG
ncbi:hypothetical protein BU16DRAFT_545380 [Lophium mytilinum]|uniref:Uncharacterized protein n=1 Tax=Lophium mytilinum TaxID=390894 RepID=A0A6A6Q7T6_9PEZI|nr:hypothetical protein BU16DRAFT_545380 [Lophium mytilinum]